MLLNSAPTCTMCVHDDLGERGSIYNCLIARVVPQYAVKLVEIVIYDHSTVQYSWIRLAHPDQVQISYSFRLLDSARSAVSAAILIVPALVLLPPSNCTCWLAHCEINSTRGSIQGNIVYTFHNFSKILVPLLKIESPIFSKSRYSCYKWEQNAHTTSLLNICLQKFGKARKHFLL